MQAAESYNDGACDGWLRAGDNDEFAIGFYTKQDLPFFSNAAPQWTVCDHYFSAIMAGTFANRVYQHAAQTDRPANTFELSTLPTIWDRLAEAGLDGRYYFSDIPFLALWGAKYARLDDRTRHFSTMPPPAHCRTCHSLSRGSSARRLARRTTITRSPICETARRS